MAKKKADKIQDFLSKVKKQLKKCVDADAHNRTDAIECLKMLNGDEHWNPDEAKRRKLEGRPCLTVPLFPTFVNQVVGEMLHNRARVKIKPGDHKSSPHIAKIRSGIIANAEYRSNGEDVYMNAGKTQVACGYGAWRINTQYTEENPFIQEFGLEAIPNPFTVYLDPERKDEAGADAQYGFILTRMPRSKFEEEWPHAEYPADTIKTGLGLKDELYFDKDIVTVAEYFVIKPEKVMMCQMEDGSVLTEEEADELPTEHKESAPAELSPDSGLPAPSPVGPASDVPQPAPVLPGQPAGQPPMPPGAAQLPAPQPAAQLPAPQAPKILQRRETSIRRVKRYVITATQILGPEKSKTLSESEYDAKLLDGEAIPGIYIPIVLVLGITMNIQGKTYIKGLIRDARDAQRLVNYWETAVAEAIALAPKAPWVGTPRQFEGFEEDYKNANVKNLPYMLYNMDVDGGVAAPPPMRQRPADPPVALFNQASRAADNLKRVIGMFGHDVGEGGPERTGAAVWAKQKPTDISTYVYAYKLNRAIEHSGKIMNSMIGEIYDTERDVRIRNVDDTETVVPVNTTIADAIRRVRKAPHIYKGLKTLDLVKLYQEDSGAIFNDLTVGKYETIVSVGPSYATARAEASAQMMSLVNAVPQIGKIGGDIIVEGIMDNTQGERLAARIRKTMPPGLIEPREGEQPYKPPPPPQMILAIEKTKTEGIRQQKGLIEQKVALVKLYKETQETDTAMRKQIIQILAELHSPTGTHPADGPPQIEGAME